MFSEFSMLSRVTAALIIIGAINWGLIGFFNYNLVADLLSPTFERVIYALVGLSGLVFMMSYLVPSIKHAQDPDHVLHHH